MPSDVFRTIFLKQRGKLRHMNIQFIRKEMYRLILEHMKYERLTTKQIVLILNPSGFHCADKCVTNSSGHRGYPETNKQHWTSVCDYTVGLLVSILVEWGSDLFLGCTFIRFWVNIVLFTNTYIWFCCDFVILCCSYIINYWSIYVYQLPRFFTVV